MIELSCLCGGVRIAIEKRPDFANACNCTLCCKSGGQWSYLHPSEVDVQGPTRTYTREDKADPAAAIHFCPRCGATTHFTLTESAVAKFGNVQMGVNMLLADERELAGMEIRYPDGRAWSGEGGFGYVWVARVIGKGSAPE